MSLSGGRLNVMQEAKERCQIRRPSTYIELARTILSKDQSEAREYFNKAIEVARQDRRRNPGTLVDAILDLADCVCRP